MPRMRAKRSKRDRPSVNPGHRPGVRPAGPADGEALARIYNHYVTRTAVSFEEQPVAAAELARRVADSRAASLPWLVAEEAGRVLGYAYAVKWKVRSAYRFSVEVGVYLDPKALRRGLGTSLYDRLFPLLEARGVHSALAGIALPNPASVALHEKFGFKQAALYREVGFKFGRWIDVGTWQRIL